MLLNCVFNFLNLVLSKMGIFFVNLIVVFLVFVKYVVFVFFRIESSLGFLYVNSVIGSW